jgi:elongation factor G
MGVKAALANAGTVLLEPVSIVTITVPADLQGPVLTDLSSRRAHVNATESTADGGTRIVASAPEAELGRYVLELRSLTGGRAQLSIKPDRYERAPSTRG